MYRPEEWKNPYRLKAIDASRGSQRVAHKTYEDGADAILEALKKWGRHTNGHTPTLCINVRPEQKGWLVFIPEE